MKQHAMNNDKKGTIMANRHYYSCPVAATLVQERLGVRFHWADGSDASAYDRLEYGTGRGLPVLYVNPDSLHLLNSLTVEQKAAMHLLDLWPESEAA